MNKVVVLNKSIPDVVIMALEKLGVLTRRETIVRAQAQKMNDAYADQVLKEYPIDRMPQA